MTFLTPWLLYGFGALAVPIIIHLWQRKKVVVVPFGTLRFLKIIAAKTNRSAKVENLLLLLLRCLFFALIIAAAARPVVSPQSMRLLGGNAPRTLALVVDQSMSMSYKSGDETRLERAKREAQAVIDDLKPGDSVAVIAVGDRAKMIVAEPTVDHALARQAIESIQPTEARTDLGSGLREARKAVSTALRGTKQIFLFTDAQESGWQFDHGVVFDAAWRQTDAKLIVIRPDDLTPVNAAVTRVRFDAPFATPGSMTRGVATVENHSAAPLRDILEIKLGGDKMTAKPVEAAPGSSVEVPFEFQMPTILERWTQGTANLNNDNLPGDDHCYFVLPVYQPPRVLIVESDAGPERARSAFYLRKALATGAQGAPIKTCTPAELDDTPVEPFSAVFLAAVPSISDRASVRLDRYLEAGGTVVFMPGDQTDLASLARLDWMPAKPVKMRELPAGRLTAFALEPTHPLFANSWDANTPFPALPQRKLLEWKATGAAKSNGRTLLTLGELPFIIFGERGTGRVIVINASPDRSWGDFPLTSAYLPLMQQVGRLSMTRAGKETSYFVGDAVPAPLSLPRDQALTIKLPKGDILPVQAGAPLLERAEFAGVYSVASPTEGELHQFAVNIDPRETNLAPLAEEQLTQMIGHESVTGIEALRLWLAQSRGLVPLWPLLLVLAVLCFCVEAIYSNLLARRRSQGGDEHIRTGRLNKRRIGQPFRPAETTEAKEVMVASAEETGR